MKLYFITSNKNKFEEAKAILPILKQADIDLDEIQEIDPKKIIEHKLKEALNHKRGNFIVEDGSLKLECLGSKLPGPLIKWFWKELGIKGLFELCKKYNSYRAEASITLGYSDGKNTKFFEGKVKGKIVKPVSHVGFGFDPIFKPDGFVKTYHEMTMDEKNSMSHRRMALNKLKRYLKEKDVI